MKWLICLLIGHKWRRYGFPSHDKDDQLFWCIRCHAMPLVGHNEKLPRFEKPIHWNRKELKIFLDGTVWDPL